MQGSWRLPPQPVTCSRGVPKLTEASTLWPVPFPPASVILVSGGSGLGGLWVVGGCFYDSKLSQHSPLSSLLMGRAWPRGLSTAIVQGYPRRWPWMDSRAWKWLLPGRMSQNSRDCFLLGRERSGEMYEESTAAQSGKKLINQGSRWMEKPMGKPCVVGHAHAGGVVTARTGRP